MNAAPDVAWVVHDDVAYLAHLPRGPIVALEGSAGLIWAGLMGTDSSTALVERIRAQLADAPDDLDALVAAFVARLVADGWVADPTSPSAHDSQPML